MSYNKETGMYEGYIYCITNKVNGKQYIGQTTRSISRRWYEHATYSSKSAISYAINKYGKPSFSLETLETIATVSKTELVEALASLEIYHIDILKTLIPDGYNKSTGGESGSIGTHWNMSEEQKLFLRQLHTGLKHSDETKKKISEIKKGTITSDETKEKLRITSSKYKHSSETKKTISDAHLNKKKPYVSKNNCLTKSKKVFQYDLYGTFINSYSSAREAARQLCISQSCISKCCNNKMSFYKNYIWRYTDDNCLKSEKDTKEFSKLLKNKIVEQYTLDGILLNTYSSLTKASENTGFSKSGISKCCLGYYKQSNGYIWDYLTALDF